MFIDKKWIPGTIQKKGTKFIHVRCNDDTVYMTSEGVFSLMFTPITQFRPHWLLTNGAKIYADDDEIDVLDNDGYDLFDKLLKEFTFKRFKIYQPYQYENKECDFSILFNDGSHMWARWIGKEYNNERFLENK